MENESTLLTEPAPARFHYHLALLNVFLPLLWPVMAALALFQKEAAPKGPLQKKWKRYLLALLAVDLVVFACYAWMILHPDRLEAQPRESDRPRIGVAWDPDPAKPAARIHTVIPGSPAGKSGFRAGDVVEKIDGTPVADKTAATEMIRGGEAGRVRTFTVRRDGVSIVLEVAAEVPQREERKLFEPQPGEKTVDWKGVAFGFLPALAVSGIAALVSFRKRRAPVVVWRGFLVASLGSFAVAIATALLFRALQGGSSMGAMLVMLFTQMGALLGLTKLATVWCGRNVPPPADPLPSLPPQRATLLGIYYLITGVARVSVVVWTADQILFGGTASARNQGLEVLATSPLGVWGTILFVLAVVFLGPIAEESLFRGFLVPRLAAMWGNAPAMVVSSMIFALFHPYHGLIMPIVFLYGVVFAWARLRTGGITVPFLLHMAVNGLVSVVMLSR